MNSNLPMNEELQQLKEQLASAKSLRALKSHPEWEDLKQLWTESVKELKDIGNVANDADVTTEVKARKYAADFLMGIIDSVDNAEDDAEKLEQLIENKGRSDSYS